MAVTEVKRSKYSKRLLGDGTPKRAGGSRI